MTTPRVARVIDICGLGHFDEFHTAFIQQVGQYVPRPLRACFDPRNTNGHQIRPALILCETIYSHRLAFTLAVLIHRLTQMEITVCPSLERNIFARVRLRSFLDLFVLLRRPNTIESLYIDR